MKTFVVLILIFLVATQAFSKWVILLEYEWNKEYIANTLCENKAKPVLKCGGKCQLAKKMAAEENNTSPQTPNLKSKFQEIVFGFETLAPQSFSTTAVRSKTFADYLLKTYPAPAFSIFHPPA
ncbi:MAG TPA: hypothetical protein VMR70_20290 [Flavisolibacter sp.]|nr:hypothetical protein [Flavisolibacter sp.]